MTTEQFLEQLEQNLQTLPAEERQNALAYYREYLAESGNSPDAVEALGSPQSVAAKILEESMPEAAGIGRGMAFSGSTAFSDVPQDDPVPQKSNVGRILLLVVVLVFGSPLWITALSLWVALECTLAGILLTTAFSAIAAPVQGICYLAKGQIGAGFWDIGAGLVCLGLTMLLWRPFLHLAVRSAKGFWNGAIRLIKALLGRE